MLGKFLKRLVNAAVLGLAALTFFLVPVGRKTAFQHAVAVFTSRPAREAGASFADVGRKAASSVHTEVQKLVAEDQGKPPVPGASDSPPPAESRP